MNDERNKKYFCDTFGEITAPSALVGKVLDMTENNERKARPIITKKLVIIATVVALVVVTALVAIAAIDFDFAHEVAFGNRSGSIFEVDPETGKTLPGTFTIPDEDFIFDLPATIDPNKLPIPEGLEPSIIYEYNENGELKVASERYYKHAVNLFYNGSFIDFDENGKEYSYGKNLYINVYETFKNTRVTVLHDGEMHKAQIGDFEIYYYHIDEIRDDGSITRTTSYVTLGEKYCIKINTIAFRMDKKDTSLTLEEISAIIEAIDNMIYPD